jgi:hypothetical protein
MEKLCRQAGAEATGVASARIEVVVRVLCIVFVVVPSGNIDETLRERKVPDEDLTTHGARLGE